MITIELLELNPFGKGMSSHTPVFEKYSPSTKTIRLFKKPIILIKYYFLEILNCILGFLMKIIKHGIHGINILKMLFRHVHNY